MKIFDCFTFYNELEMLDIRLHVLDSVVDYFVLAEIPKTHLGLDKEKIFDLNRERFSKFSHKIIYISSDKVPEAKGYGDWTIENFQRNLIFHGLNGKCDYDDVIMISDLDEIPNPYILKNLKKVELHLHLDGSVELNTISKITNENIDTLKEKMIAKDKCENLSEYLTKFDTPIECMQTKENLTLIAKDLVNYLERENVIYAEIRFAPMFHTKEGLSYEDVIESVLEGVNSNKNVKTNLILCMMRGFSKEANLKTIEVAEKYLNKGVCALDLAGAEDKYPLIDYIDLFDIIKEKNIPFTIHAGENGSHKEIDLAIKLGTKRIGHGIHAYESENTINLLKEKNILLEICPTSNVQTNSINEYKNHPIYNFYELGINVCINTDNKTVSNISINDEYIKLYNTFNFNTHDFKIMNVNAIKSSFLSDEEKEKLIDEIIHK